MHPVNRENVSHKTMARCRTLSIECVLHLVKMGAYHQEAYPGNVAFARAMHVMKGTNASCIALCDKGRIAVIDG
jgi:hypothetical protein